MKNLPLKTLIEICDEYTHLGGGYTDLLKNCVNAYPSRIDLDKIMGRCHLSTIECLVAILENIADLLSDTDNDETINEINDFIHICHSILEGDKCEDE